MELVQLLRSYLPKCDDRLWAKRSKDTALAADLIDKQATELAAARAEIEKQTRGREVYETGYHQLYEELAAEQAKNVGLLETLTGILESDWRKWDELASPEEFVRWAKSRANHAISATSDTSALEAMIAKAGEKMKEWCASASQAVIDSGAYDGHQQYAAAACRDVIRALPGVTLEDLK